MQANISTIILLSLFAVSVVGFSEDLKHVKRFGCPVTVLINRTQSPWNNRDYNILASIKKDNRCSVQEPGNPCVIRFFKMPNSYYVECGKKRPL